MIIQIKWPKVIVVVSTALLSIAIVVCCFHSHQSNSDKAAMATFDDQNIESKLLVYVFLDAIREQSDQFYAPYYTLAPTIAFYSTQVCNIKEKGANIEITFFSLPYIGPHDTIGEDEITFQVTHSGEITPKSFRHLKSYSLPDNLIDLQKELPPVVKNE